ncbi:MAG TPA: hypothetical protein VMZ30_04450, partial [Pyrinomonadaceae bacterium]|nr:hypothetical protein [Pyrinomonadaceae bacterium]
KVLSGNGLVEYGTPGYMPNKPKVVATVLLASGKIQLLRSEPKEGDVLKFVWTCSLGADCFQEYWLTDQDKRHLLERVNHRVIGKWEEHVHEKHSAEFRPTSIT